MLVKFKQERSTRTINRVLDGAMRLFSKEKKFFSAESLCAEPEVSIGSIYHHFGSLNGVICQLYSSLMQELLSTTPYRRIQKL
jgi:AcrR family transcriptional regulator